MDRRWRRAALFLAAGALGVGAAPIEPIVDPIVEPEMQPEVRWTTGGLRPSRTYQTVLPPREPDYERAMAERIPMHMDPLDLLSRERFGAGVIEIGESIKRAISEEAPVFRAGLEAHPWEATEVLVASRSPNFFPHDYGLGFRFRITVRGIYKSDQGWHQPLDVPVDANVLIGEGGLTRVDLLLDTDWKPEAAAGGPPELADHLLKAAQHLENSYGPLELQGMEALLRDKVRATVFEPAQGRPAVNPVFREAYVPIALKTVTLPVDLLDAKGYPYPDGKPDEEGLRIVNRTVQIERGPLTRGGPPRFDFQNHAGWEVWLGERKIFEATQGRIKFALVGDTDGDWIPDLVLLEDRARRRTSHVPYHPVHRAYLRPAVYFVDGQDMVRGVFDLGPVRFDFPPGADGSEIRRLSLEPRVIDGKQRDWDVGVEVFDPLGRVISREDELVFDRFPANRRPPEKIGYQRAEFHGPAPRRERGVKLRAFFGMGKHTLTAEEEQRLIALLEEKIRGDVVIRGRLVGNTCDGGSDEHNFKLGMRRARTVLALLARMGIRPTNIRVDTRGELDPRESNTTEAGRSLNRRVDGWLVVRPAPRRRAPYYGRFGARLPYEVPEGG